MSKIEYCENDYHTLSVREIYESGIAKGAFTSDECSFLDALEAVKEMERQGLIRLWENERGELLGHITPKGVEVWGDNHEKGL